MRVARWGILQTGKLSRQAFQEPSIVVARPPAAVHARIARMNGPVDTPRMNELGQPIGRALPGWTAPPFPPHVALGGQYSRLEPLDVRHARDLWEAQSADPQ